MYSDGTTEVNGWSIYGIINFSITRNKLWMNHHLGTVFHLVASPPPPPPPSWNLIANMHTTITLYVAPSNSSNSRFALPLTNFLTETLLLLCNINP